MAMIDLPELPPIVAHLVRSGMYTIYAVVGSPLPYVLYTSDGAVYFISQRGSISAPMPTKSLSDFTIREAIDLRSTAPPESVVHINNA
ncbi:MAG: hypothetical protein ABSE49_31080 [Polyangiaceae bacterium]